ncbi:MAG: hypothetical protein HYY17_13830 [Planctomycetes bacterium]|nr:hypothetical protein [Planctomycetota bacterium]
MRTLLMLVLGLGVFTPTQDDLAFDPWSAWSSFGVDSTVVMQMESGGMKVTTTTTLVAKTDDEITLKVETKAEGMDAMASEQKVKKPEKGDADAKCPLCDKPAKEHKDMGKRSEETLKVGDKELKCTVIESPEKDCKGNAIPGKSKMWYCKDVPGRLVKMEYEYKEMMMKSTQTLVSFDAKK